MTKSNTERQREFKDRMRSQGLVRKEVWILPHNSEAMKEVEQYFRNPKCKAWYYTSSNGMIIGTLGESI